MLHSQVSFLCFSYQIIPLIPLTIVLVRVRVHRRVSSIRDLQLSMIIILVLLGFPVGLDRWEGSASIAAGVRVWYWLRGPGLGVEDTAVGRVEEAV